LFSLSCSEHSLFPLFFCLSWTSFFISLWDRYKLRNVHWSWTESHRWSDRLILPADCHDVRAITSGLYSRGHGFCCGWIFLTPTEKTGDAFLDFCSECRPTRFESWVGYRPLWPGCL
jgi:hypothetical protein